MITGNPHVDAVSCFVLLGFGGLAIIYKLTKGE